LQIKEQAQLSLEQNENFIKEMTEKIKKSEELLERAQDQQAATAELLAELDEANETANDAVKRGDQTLKEAQETLKKLGGKFKKKNSRNVSFYKIRKTRKFTNLFLKCFSLRNIFYYNFCIVLEFDAEVQRERIKAQSALKDIQKIEELINNANMQAIETERVLNGSEGNAKSAREIAQNAQV